MMLCNAKAWDQGPYDLSGICTISGQTMKLLHMSNVTGSKVRRPFEYQNIKHHEIRPNKGPTSNMKKQWYVGAKVSCPTPISRVCSLDTDKWSLMVTRVYSSHGVQSV